jgi:hypothetical protein
MKLPDVLTSVVSISSLIVTKWIDQHIGFVVIIYEEYDYTFSNQKQYKFW